MKRRIIRADHLNWAIQTWQDGGATISRGRYAGQQTTPKWKAADSFHPTLEQAAAAMLDDEIGDRWEDAATGTSLQDAIQAATETTSRAIQDARESLETSFLIGILQERGYTITSGTKGRTNYTNDDDASLTRSEAT